jgi:hypothetical protein
MPILSDPAIRRRSDPYFFVGMALAIVATNIVGFTRAFLRTNIAEELHSVWVTAHAYAFICWILLFLAQTILVASQRRDIHRRLGVSGAALAGIMVALTIMSGIGVFLQGAPRPAIDTFMLSVVVHINMIDFTILVTAALLHRHSDPEIHKRLMLLATITVGVRFTFVGRLLGMHLSHYVDQDLFVLAAILYDLIARRRVNPAYIWGGLLVLIVPPAADEIFKALVPHLVAHP